jgi:hypothetical protein
MWFILVPGFGSDISEMASISQAFMFILLFGEDDTGVIRRRSVYGSRALEEWKS